MATSGSYSFSITRDQIIRMAMIFIGKLAEQETPSPQDVVDCSMILNMMVKQWQGTTDYAPGLKTWTLKHGHLFLNNATGQYTVGPGGTGWTNSYQQTALTVAAAANASSVTVASSANLIVGMNIGIVLDSGVLFWTTISNIAGSVLTLGANLPSSAASTKVVFAYATVAQMPLGIRSVALRDSTNNDTPINIITDVRTYDALPTKNNIASASDPTAIYYESGLTNGTLYTDVGAAQDVTKHLTISYFESIQDFVSATDNPYYPQEWYLALAWGLAEQIAPVYNAPWTEKMEKNATKALAIAQKKDPENVIYFFEPGNDGR